MNVLLVRPKPHKDTINLQSFMICEPLELEYVAAQLTCEGHDVDIVDMIVEKRSLIHFLKAKRYDKVGFTCYITAINVVKEYALIVKKFDKNIVTMVGGIVAEVNPEYLEDSNIDEIITEFSIPTCFPMREKTKEYREKYNYIFHDGCATIKTSYGCPYNCEFCYCAAITGGKYSARNIDDVVAEIQTIEEDKIFIVDDNFLFNNERLEQFCSLLEHNNIKKEFIVFGRTDFVSDEKNLGILQRLYCCGLRAVFMGLESFVQAELSKMNKRTSVDNNVKAVKTLESLNINAYLGIIVGYDWTRSDFDNLINHLNKFKYPFVNIQPILPLKGTPFYEQSKDKILLSKDRLELWDMAHLAMLPQKMSVRKFYYNLLRVYMKTMLKSSVRRYLLKRYGKETYHRTKRGAIKIFWQYVKLMLKGRV